MELPNQQLANVYVDHFELNHLADQDIAVKSEYNGAPNHFESSGLRQGDSLGGIRRGEWLDKLMESPPLQESLSMLLNGQGTPTNTTSNAPAIPNRPPGMMHEWLPDRKPSDHWQPYRPADEPRIWESNDYIPSGIFPEASNYYGVRPHSVYSAVSDPSPRHNSVCSSDAEDIKISDEMLTTISAKALNKTLRGCTKEEIMKWKRRRRTLKNRMYARECRSKRVHIKETLEIENVNLRNEVQQLKLEISRISRERDIFKHKLLVVEDQSQNLVIDEDLDSSPDGSCHYSIRALGKALIRGGRKKN